MLENITDKQHFYLSAYHQCQSKLLKYTISMVQSRAVAEEIVQEAFLRFIKSDIKEVRKHYTPWLFTVCRNLAIDRLRKQGREIQFDVERIVDSASNDPQDQLIRKEIRNYLDGLKVNEREVIYLKFFGERSYREIEQITGINQSTIGVIIHRGLCKLNALLNKEGVRNGI